jgi:hypothetical protein
MRPPAHGIGNRERSRLGVFPLNDSVVGWFAWESCEFDVTDLDINVNKARLSASDVSIIMYTTSLDR